MVETLQDSRVDAAPLPSVLLAVDVTAAFIYFSRNATPFWVTVVGAASLLGIGVGFAGFFALMIVAGWGAFRESRRVQVLPPEHPVTTPPEPQTK